jgi:hypothetical protein
MLWIIVVIVAVVWTVWAIVGGIGIGNSGGPYSTYNTNGLPDCVHCRQLEDWWDQLTPSQKVADAAWYATAWIACRRCPQ